MSKAKKRISRRAKSGESQLWQKLNQPVDLPEPFLQGVLKVSVVLLVFAWVAPFLSIAQAQVTTGVYESAIVVQDYYGQVAGAQSQTAPLWYEVAKSVPQDVMVAFSQAAVEVLDVSEPVSEFAEFYAPSVSAFRDAWLELMADPY